LPEHYVTLFDSYFLPQGLALHESLENKAEEFMLWVICIDDKTKNVLDLLEKSTIRTIALAEVETPALLSVKQVRTRAEYCWTLSPFTAKWVFAQDSGIERVTYIDADMYLFKSPRAIFREFEESGKAVLITEHAYDAEYDQSAYSGQYCVQFMIFQRYLCEPVRQWWEDRCVEWCYARLEDGKFGDQKYLDDWPERFPEYVHVLSQLDLILGPFNAKRFPYSRAIAFHFSGVKILNTKRVMLHSSYIVPKPTDINLYVPYAKSLRRQLNRLNYCIIQYSIKQRIQQWFLFYRSAIYQTLKSGKIQSFNRRVKIIRF
jgi:hypothetical protein